MVVHHSQRDLLLPAGVLPRQRCGLAQDEMEIEHRISQLRENLD
jgi:hypothetical protein